MDAIKQYIKKLVSNGEHSPNTLRSYTSDLRRFEQFLFNSHPKSDGNGNISIQEFLAFLDSEYQSGYKPSTVHRRKVSLMQFADYLLQSGEIGQEDIEELVAWKHDIWHQIKQRELHYLSEAEIQKLFDTILLQKSTRIYRDISIISMVLETGLSIDPIIKLNVSDLELRSKQVRVENGEGEVWYSIKNSVNYLKEYLKSSRPELTQTANEEALFVSQMGSRITRQGVWQVIKGWGEAADLATPLSPRILRHSAVVRMVDSGIPISDIQLLLGHTNIFSTKALIRKLEQHNQYGGSK